MGAEIFSAANGRADDLVGRAAQAKQCCVDPAGSEKGAENFAGCSDRKWGGISAEVDFPAVGVKKSIGRLPPFRKARQQPETDSLMGVTGCCLDPDPGFCHAPELTEGSDGDGPIPTGGLLRTVVGGHFRKNETGQGFLDFQGEEAHSDRIDL